jgi:hypothetical protein
MTILSQTIASTVYLQHANRKIQLLLIYTMLVYQSLMADSELLTRQEQEAHHGESALTMNLTHPTSMVAICLPMVVSLFTVYNYLLGAYILFHASDFFDARCNTHSILDTTIYHSELVFDCSQIPTWEHIQPYLPSRANVNLTITRQHWHAVAKECQAFQSPTLKMLLSCLVCVCISSAIVLPQFRVWLEEAKSNLSRRTGQHTFYNLFNTNLNPQYLTTEGDLTRPCAMQKLLAWQLLAFEGMVLVLHVVIFNDGSFMSSGHACAPSVGFQFCWTIFQVLLGACLLVSVVLCTLSHIQHKRLQTQLVGWRIRLQHQQRANATDWACLYCPESGVLYTGELGTLQCSC